MDTVEMTPNVERLGWWADDLASGKYKQGQGGLACYADGNPVQDSAREEEHDSFCCLGVAAMTALDHGYKGPVDWTNGILQVELQDWYGIGANPYLTERPAGACNWADCDCQEGITATELNDGDKRPFAEIAEMIRDKYGIAVEAKEPAAA